VVLGCGKIPRVSIQWIGEVWANGAEDSNDRLVQLALADNADLDGRCWPSLLEICRKTRLSESSVRRSIQHLEKEGRLIVQRGRGAGNTSHYQLRKVSERKVSERKVSEGKKKGVTQKEKGVTVTNPPDPLLGRTVKNRKEPSEEFELPDVIPASAWEDYRQHRNSSKRKMTLKAEQLAIKKLLELQQAGHDPEAVIEQSIVHGWIGLFQINAHSAGVANATVGDRSEQNRSQQRVDQSSGAFRRAAERRGVSGVDGFAHLDDGPLSASGKVC